MIEVKANLSFDRFRQGGRYQVDGSDSRVQAQVAGGYFTITKVLGDSDVAASADVADNSGDPAGSDLGSGVAGSKKKGRPRKEVADGEGVHQPAEDDSVRASENVAFGGENG